jgi:putative ABC transport system substrate-binding protein
MKRRKFITLLAGAAVWPLVGYGADPRPRIGVLTLLSARNERGRITAFIAGMRELGYVPGQNIDIEYRHADGDT